MQIKIKVVDAKGKDVKGNGTLDIKGNTVKFILNKQNDSFAYLAGQTYTITIKTKIRDNVTDAELAPYIKEGGIPNQADLVFGPAGTGEIVKSEIPTVTPPIKKPVINKDVEGQEHLDLANRNDKFNWNIKVQFGNDTASWEQAVVQDEINSLLEIVDADQIKVVDAKGKDVKGNGTLDIKGNTVKFILNKQNDSFAYLAGQTYTITIKTKIRDNVTNAELAPYIKEGGIPNQADLVFGPAGTGEIVKSEIPTVTPPIKKPVINKDVEGQEHLDLANRNDKFNWNIKVQFGNDTASWEQAVVQDEINSLLEIVDADQIKVVDAKGKDVKGNGTLDIKGNTVKFILNKQNDSFAYLAGQTYTITIKTKIRDNVTDARVSTIYKRRWNT